MAPKLHSRLWPALAAVAACAALIAANAGAAQTGPTTLHLTSKAQPGAGFAPSGRPRPGARLGFGDRISGDDSGYARGVCTIMPKSQGVLCTIQLQLSKGTITAQGMLPERSRNSPVAITGGTGAYDGARGTALATDTSPSSTSVEITLLP
jgi:hypothetical protein